MRRRYKVIVADPPWSFGDKLPGKTRGAERNYRVMSAREVERCEPYADLVHRDTEPDALLFLWRVASQVEEAMGVARAWGFVPKSEIVWVKTTKNSYEVDEPLERPSFFKLHFGMGRYVRAAHETCIVAARGKAAALVKDHSVRSVFFAPVGRHSQKPEAFFDLVERLSGGPYLELFARRFRRGWTCMGDQVKP